MTNDLSHDNHLNSHTDPYLESLLEFIKMIAGMEPDFGAAKALLRYGQTFEPAETTPAWFARGVSNHCFDNATHLLVARKAAGDNSVRYAEGYAMDAEVPVPMQHAWLVDANDKVIDPTWRNTDDNLYFGIVFDTKFVLDLMQIKRTTGILVDARGMRRHYGTAELLEAGMFRRTAV